MKQIWRFVNNHLFVINSNKIIHLEKVHYIQVHIVVCPCFSFVISVYISFQEKQQKLYDLDRELQEHSLAFSGLQEDKVTKFYESFNIK